LESSSKLGKTSFFFFCRQFHQCFTCTFFCMKVLHKSFSLILLWRKKHFRMKNSCIKCWWNWHLVLGLKLACTAHTTKVRAKPQCNQLVLCERQRKFFFTLTKSFGFYSFFLSLLSFSASKEVGGGTKNKLFFWSSSTSLYLHVFRETKLFISFYCKSFTGFLTKTFNLQYFDSIFWCWWLTYQQIKIRVTCYFRRIEGTWIN